MNFVKLSLVVAVLLCIAILSGCQEGYSKTSGMQTVDKVAYQPTGTGFWHPSK